VLKFLHYGYRHQARSQNTRLLCMTKTLSALLGLSAAATPSASADVSLEASVTNSEEQSITVASFWPRRQGDSEKTATVKPLSNGAKISDTSPTLALEDISFSGGTFDEVQRTHANGSADTASQLVAFSTQAIDLRWDTFEITPPIEQSLPSPEAELEIAQIDEESDAYGDCELTSAAQNPIANLISLPFQNNTNFGVGPLDRTQNVLNIQPVYPVPLNEDLLLVTRIIVPVVTQPDINWGNHIWGLGDINPSFFFVHLGEGNVTWGAGPTFLLPTPWVFGGLLSQVWSVAGDSDRADLSVLTGQPFVNYNLPYGWYLTSSPLINVNWNASGEKLTLPIGRGFGRVFPTSHQPVNASAQVYWNEIAPERAGDLNVRFSFSLLLPG